MDKPDGFDFRDRRSDKTGSAKDWTPADALYKTTLDLDADAGCLVIMWLSADGRLHHRKAGSSAECAWMAAKFLQHCV
jgi:hypothetical protein